MVEFLNLSWTRYDPAFHHKNLPLFQTVLPHHRLLSSLGLEKPTGPQAMNFLSDGCFGDGSAGRQSLVDEFGRFPQRLFDRLNNVPPNYRCSHSCEAF